MRSVECGTRSKKASFGVFDSALQISQSALGGPASIKVMQRTFNPQNRARYPGGPPAFARSFGSASQFIASWCNSSIPGFDPDGLGASPSKAANVGKSSFDRSVVK